MILNYFRIPLVEPVTQPIWIEFLLPTLIINSFKHKIYHDWTYLPEKYPFPLGYNLKFILMTLSLSIK